MFLSAAASHTSLNRSTLSSIVQFIFFLHKSTEDMISKITDFLETLEVIKSETYFENVSEAAPNMATSSAPASI